MIRFSTIFGVYSALALLCYWLTRNDMTNMGMAYDFSTMSHFDVALAYLQSVVPFFVGALAFDSVIGFFRSKQSIYIEGTETSHSGRVELKPTTILIYLAILTCAFVAAGAPLWSRDYYHLSEVGKSESEAAGSFLDLLGAMFALAIGIAPAVLRYFIFSVGSARMALRLALFLDLLFLYGVGTKLIAAVLGLYLISGYANGSKRVGWLTSLEMGSTIALLALVLVQRNEKLYGIETIPMAIFLMFTHSYDALSFALQVIGSAVPITAETLRDSLPISETLAIELSPFSGFASGWYQIYDRQRLNFAVPYSALGTIAAYSLLHAAVYGALCSAAIAGLAGVLRKLLGKPGVILVLIVSVMFCGMLGQYNLRSVTRYIYYIFMLWALHRAFLNLGRIKNG